MLQAPNLFHLIY